MRADAATYWATVAQVAPLFGLGIVVELRRVVRTWDRSNRLLRAWQSLTSGVAAVFLIIAFNTAMSSLARGDDTAGSIVVNLSLSFAIGILVLNPVLDLATVANADWLALAVAFLAHPVASTLRVVRSARLRPLLQENVVLALEILEASERHVDLIVRNIQLAASSEPQLDAARKSLALAKVREPHMTHQQRIELKRLRALIADLANTIDTHDADRDLDKAIVELGKAWDSLIMRVDRREQTLDQLASYRRSQSEAASVYLEQQLARVRRENKNLDA